MPLQILSAAIDTEIKPLQQQILQQWAVSDEILSSLVLQLEIVRKTIPKINIVHAEAYLKNQLGMCSEKNEIKNALPFDLIIKQELFEITKNRIQRGKELLLTDTKQREIRDCDGHSIAMIDADTVPQPQNDKDPQALSKHMQLKALAFSGGGIRSATFNLGVLQALAKTDHLNKFDYLSTVSGGGYIGSWLVAWIKREGSMLKVCDRLNRDKSGDPMAEEVRPIRWLRMYSNYLTPTIGIMSVDSWTVGMTILRNMLLNQLIIFLLFMSTLLFGKFLFIAWVDYFIGIPDEWVIIISSAFIICAAILAGMGMRSYHTKGTISSRNPIFTHLRKYLSLYLLLLGYATALLIGAALFCRPFPKTHLVASEMSIYIAAFYAIKWPVFSSFTALLLVALFGRYDKCVPELTFNSSLFAKIVHKIRIPLILFFSALATLIGAIALIFAWKLIYSLSTTSSAYAIKHLFNYYSAALVFIFGPPLILEVLSIAIVMRMALLGIYFPDERREWWGRIGGHVHRISFLWIIVVGAALVGNTLVNDIIPEGTTSNILKAAGGWGVLLLAAVKAAFSPKSDSDKPGVVSTVFGVLATAGPYLFAFGLLFFLPVLLNNTLNDYFKDDQNNLGFLFVATLALSTITLLLAWRIGVNEFSMHHFYKNRLVRAFLGGTRSRIKRGDTSSPFTGFDASDDLLLSSLVHDQKYYGPYPILNTALNASKVADLDRQDRKAESFIFSPLYCGFDFSPTRASGTEFKGSFDYGYRPTSLYAYPKGPHLGSAMSISGAAANPNQGFHSSAPTAFLLTAFNARLGWWIGNPRKKSWTSADPDFGLPYLISNLVGKSNTSDRYVSLSDGGHFDNTGLYEMIRRRVSFIILGDAEQDDKFTCEALANTIRRCWIDFGVEIDINVEDIIKQSDGFSKSSFAIGKIIYPGMTPWLGALIYLKSSVSKDLPADIREYAMKNPTFPHQTTGDQFFDEAQFESYRKLGYTIAMQAMANPKVKSMFSRL
ncbi:MAG: patatin-like phospholipase family protein [Pedobacter sp.]|nr:MAG: patatin-like phospholipase family protein [Pedobacter sp.]